MDALLPRDGGYVMVVVECYFDESYRKDDEPQTFCVAGYVLTAPAARAMQEEWRLVLAEHGAPYWHSREIHNEEGAGEFSGWPKDRRDKLQRDLIGLIKKYTMEGLAIVDAHSRLDTSSGERAVYSLLSDAAARAIRGFAETHRIGRAGLVVFEAGHPHEHSAKEKVAAFCAPLGISYAYATKRDEPLLQAADLLAWHARKHVQDTDPNPPAPQRKDFEALIEHPHTIWRMVNKDGENTAYIELWPVGRRAMYGAVETWLDESGPLPMVMHGGDPAPAIFCSAVGGWKSGFNGMIYLRGTTVSGAPFYLVLNSHAAMDLMKQLDEGGTAMWGQASEPDEDEG